MSEVVVHEDKCIVCCECINVCREEVLGLIAGKIKVVKPKQCSYCEDCSDICENKAIEVVHDKQM